MLGADQRSSWRLGLDRTGYRRNRLAAPGPGRAQRTTRVHWLDLSGDITVIDLTIDDWARVHELVTSYADISLDIIDASTIAAAERLNQTAIATLDERDFRIVRPANIDAFELLPGPD